MVPIVGKFEFRAPIVKIGFCQKSKFEDWFHFSDISKGYAGKLKRKRKNVWRKMKDMRREAIVGVEDES